MQFPSLPNLPGTIPLAALLIFAGCANLPGAGGAPASAPAASVAGAAGHAGGAAASASAAASAPVPGQPPAFATVIKDARKTDGLFTVWNKDEKYWLELKPEDFGKPFFLSPKLASGIGEAGIFGGMMARPQVVEFRRMHNLVQLIARNTGFVATPGTPQAHAVAAAFSPSLLGSTMVASQPQPERKTVLIDATPLFVNDMLAVGAQLQRAFRQGYGLDGRNSGITAVRGKADMLAVEVMNHYATASIALPAPGAPPGAPVPTVPRSLPDARSLFIHLHYSLASLPAQVMAARQADPRVGHFASRVDDFGDDLARSPRVRYVDRWRLEKMDPAAALSAPVRPITYWIDRSVPLKYRDAISAGILEWNKAFERIGFKDAVEVKVQPDDAGFDTLDFGIASVRWMTNSAPQFGAIGPRHVDPRSGEILDADISVESLSSRNLRHLRSRILGEGAAPAADRAAAWAGLLQVGSTQGSVDPLRCDYAGEAADQLGYGLDVLAARGEIDPASPEAQQFVLAYLKDMTMHEVGHTLGLRHNFRASHVYAAGQLSDPEFTRTHALTGSVMEYAPINLARPGAASVAPFQTTLGPYDYWAIEYAYKPVAPADEAAELARIAARSGEPELAYGTDEDNLLGIDPDALHFDLGADALAFAAQRFEIARDLFRRQETRTLAPGEDYAGLRRSLAYAVRDAGRAAGILLRQIGGVRTLRDFPNTGRDPLQPVAAADQRAALDLLARQVLAADSFAVSPALQRRLAPDFQERGDALFGAGDKVPTDFPLAQTVLDLQRALLTQLMSDTLAARVLDSQAKVTPPAETLHLSELYRRLQAEVWSELAGRGDIAPARRELQREHVNRLAALVLRPGALTRADARGLARAQATELLTRIERAARRAGLGEEAGLHLADSAATLRAALAAPLQRQGV